MLIRRDDISNDVITPGTCFSMFVYIRARFRFTLISRNLTAQSKRRHRGIGSGIQFQRRSCRRVSVKRGSGSGPGPGPVSGSGSGSIVFCFFLKNTIQK